MSTRGKRKAEQDPDYVDTGSPAIPSDNLQKKPRAEPKYKPSKITAVDTPKPAIALKPPIVWSENDNVILRTALMELGNEYNDIADKYFKNRPAITRIEIGNHCRTTAGLKEIVASNSKEKRSELVQNFNRMATSEHSNNQKNAIVIRNNSMSSQSQTGPVVEDIEDDSPPYPIYLANGRISIPSSNFLASMPFFQEGKDRYHYVVRFHYGQFVDIEFKTGYMLIIYDPDDELHQEELDQLIFFEPKEGKPREMTMSKPRESILYVPLPPDADTNCYENKYHQATTGGILEIAISKNKSREQSIKQPRLLNRKVTVQPSVMLSGLPKQIDNQQEFKDKHEPKQSNKSKKSKKKYVSSSSSESDSSSSSESSESESDSSSSSESKEGSSKIETGEELYDEDPIEYVGNNNCDNNIKNFDQSNY